jgi:hypothetical protein
MGTERAQTGQTGSSPAIRSGASEEVEYNVPHDIVQLAVHVPAVTTPDLGLVQFNDLFVPIRSGADIERDRTELVDQLPEFPVIRLTLTPTGEAEVRRSAGSPRPEHKFVLLTITKSGAADSQQLSADCQHNCQQGEKPMKCRVFRCLSSIC